MLPVTFDLSALAGSGGALPAVSITNTFNANDYNSQHTGTTYSQPSITILAAEDGGLGVRNIQGDVKISNNFESGDINIYGAIDSKTFETITKGTLNVVKTATDPAFNVGGDPDAAFAGVTTGSYGGSTTTRARGCRGHPGQVSSVLSQTPDCDPGGVRRPDLHHAEFVNVNGILQSGKADYS